MARRLSLSVRSHIVHNTARWELPDGNRLPFSNDTISIRRDITTFSLRIGTHVENTGVRFRFAFLRYPFLNNEAIYHNTTFFSLRPNATVSSIIHCLEEIRSCRNPWLAPTILQSLHSGNASFQCYLTTQIGPKRFQHTSEVYMCSKSTADPSRLSPMLDKPIMISSSLPIIRF
jgi:hypothetical protein